MSDSDKKRKGKMHRRVKLLTDRTVSRQKRNSFQRKSLSRSLKIQFGSASKLVRRKLAQHRSRPRFMMEYDIQKPRSVMINGTLQAYEGP